VQALLIASGEAAEGFAHERALEGGEHRLDGGGLEQPCALPVLKDDLAELTAATHLARNRHEDQIAPRAVIGEAGDHDTGRCLVADWSVNGNGTSTTSPN
jgi:hypothetical protein